MKAIAERQGITDDDELELRLDDALETLDLHTIELGHQRHLDDDDTLRDYTVDRWAC